MNSAEFQTHRTLVTRTPMGTKIEFQIVIFFLFVHLLVQTIKHFYWRLLLTHQKVFVFLSFFCSIYIRAHAIDGCFFTIIAINCQRSFCRRRHSGHGWSRKLIVIVSNVNDNKLIRLVYDSETLRRNFLFCVFERCFSFCLEFYASDCCQSTICSATTYNDEGKTGCFVLFFRVE